MRKLPIFGVAALLTATTAWAQPQQGPQSTDERINVQSTPSMQIQTMDEAPSTTTTTETTTVEVLRPILSPSQDTSLHWQYFERGFHPESMPADTTIESRTRIETVTPQSDVQRPIMEDDTILDDNTVDSPTLDDTDEHDTTIERPIMDDSVEDNDTILDDSTDDSNIIHHPDSVDQHVKVEKEMIITPLHVDETDVE